MTEDDEIRSVLTRNAWDYRPTVTPEAIRRIGTGRRKRVMLRWTLATCCLGILVAGTAWVGLSRGGGSPDPASSNQDGPLLTYSGMAVKMAAAWAPGTPLTLVDGCLLLGPTPVVWPADAQWDTHERAVILTRDGTMYTLQVGQGVPAGLGGGGMPISLASKYMDKGTQTRVRECLSGRGTDVAVVN